MWEETAPKRVGAVTEEKKKERRSGNRIADGKKGLRPSKCRSKNGMNLADTIEFEELVRESETVNFQSLVNAQNAIKSTNREYVEFIKEIEEYTPEKSPDERGQAEKKQKSAKKRRRRKDKTREAKRQPQRDSVDSEADGQLEGFIDQIWKRKTKAKMFNWLLEIYVKGFEKESEVMERLQLRKKRRVFRNWKKAMRRLKKENRKREKENKELVDTFRRIILTSKVFIALKNLISRRHAKS